MLIDFSVTNYKSIRNQLSVDLVYSQRAPNFYATHDNLYFKELSNRKYGKIIPLLAMYGANATGKSNIISAVSALKSFIVNDCNSREKNFPYTPYLLSEECTKLPTEFSVVLEKNGSVYRYELAFNETAIENEKLYKILVVGEEELIFDVKKQQFNINVDPQYNLQTIYKNECDYISSFLVKLATKYVGFSKDINNVYDFIKNDLEVYTDNKFHESFAVDKVQLSTDNDLTKAIDKISRILSNMDIAIQNVNCNRSINQINSGEMISVQPNQSLSLRKANNNKIDIRFDSFKSTHKNEQGQDVEFDFLTQESYGTVTLFGLIGVIIDVLLRGKVLIIDEIERSLHSDIVKYIMRMFRNKYVNKHGAQLICASHDLHSMDSLYKSEIAIVDKINNATEMRYVSDFDVRNELDFRKNYLSGRFGGRPSMVFDMNMLED